MSELNKVEVLWCCYGMWDVAMLRKQGNYARETFVSAAFSGSAARELCLHVGNDYHLTLLYLLNICFPIYFPLSLLLFLYISVCDWFDLLIICWICF